MAVDCVAQTRPEIHTRINGGREMKSFRYAIASVAILGAMAVSRPAQAQVYVGPGIVGPSVVGHGVVAGPVVRPAVVTTYRSSSYVSPAASVSVYTSRPVFRPVPIVRPRPVVVARPVFTPFRPVRRPIRFGF